MRQGNINIDFTVNTPSTSVEEINSIIEDGLRNVIKRYTVGELWTAEKHNQMTRSDYSELWNPHKCSFCGNTSGLKDKRGGCISCGGME